MPSRIAVEDAYAVRSVDEYDASVLGSRGRPGVRNNVVFPGRLNIDSLGRSH